MKPADVLRALANKLDTKPSKTDKDYGILISASIAVLLELMVRADHLHRFNLYNKSDVAVISEAVKNNT